MAIDYESPRWTLREAASVAGYDSLNTLRAYYQRGHFRIIGGAAAQAKGIAGLLNLRDVMQLAVASRLIRAGVHPRGAFDAAVAFAHGSDGNRQPAEMYDPRSGPSQFTVMVYRPEVDRSEVIQMREGDTLGFSDLFFDQGTGARGSAIVLLLNDIEREVFSALAAIQAAQIMAVTREPELA